MVSFTCNICGVFNQVDHFETEPASCPCGSNVRMRASIYLLSMELFGQSFVLPQFPRLRSLRALGMTDNPCYASLLAEKFSYTNTYYDREPRLDITEAHPHLAGTYDFIISAEVFEHIAPPVGAAFAELHRMLKPHGFLVATVPCPPGGAMREHYPDLYQYRIVSLGDSPVLINRRRDGRVELHENLLFHGGHGATLEMRQFDTAALRRELTGAGFRDVDFLATQDLPDLGILFDNDVSQPLIARNGDFFLDKATQAEMIELWRAEQVRVRAERDRADSLERRLALAARSRWVRLGNRFGVGPRLGLANRPAATLPLAFDAAGPLAPALLGPEWYPCDGNHRWMPPFATLRLRGPANASQQLYLRGYYPMDRLQDGPLTLTLTINGFSVPPLSITPGSSAGDSFQLEVRLPREVVGLPEMQIALQVSRALSLPSDSRSLGLAFGVFEVR